VLFLCRKERGGSVEIIDLKLSQLDEVCEIFSSSYHRQRAQTPILDENNGKMEKVLPMLQHNLENHPGVAAMENGHMVGYMTGMYFDGILGVHKGAYSPEWAHGSVPDNAFSIYRRLYKEMGQQWMKQGCLTHAINFMHHAREAQKAFCWNGFGSICFDAVRPVQPIKVEIPAGMTIAPIKEEDIPLWLPMVNEHNRHLATAPAFKPYLEAETEKDLLDTLQAPGNHAWMAWLDAEAVGYMKVASEEDGAAWMINGEKKVAVNGATVKPEYRGKGIAKALLSGIMDWAVEEGFVRCSVDFEATNLEACQFWLKHFQPACRSMIRRLDERILQTCKEVVNEL
jgi:GNAT superfamily N-acetyltransferase